jgi:hypothetical protein
VEWPYRFSAVPIFSDHVSDLSTNFDRVNNVLGVTLSTPELGAYIIRITGYNVPKGPQTYVLGASGAVSIKVVRTSGDAGE